MTLPNPPKSGARSGGPQSAQGKKKSSRNALKHGATSPRLINVLEVRRYSEFLEGLKKSYPSKDPLVHMQLERISRLKIQLERVQEQMDSLHRIAAQKTDSIDLAAQAMDLNEDQTRLAAEIMSWRYRADAPDRKTFPLDRQQLHILSELADFSDGYISMLRTHDDFRKMLPHFCKYIVDQANDRGQTLGQYLRSQQSQNTDPSHPLARTNIVVSPVQDDAQTEPGQAKLTDVPVEALRNAMPWFHNEALTYLQDFYKALPIGRIIGENSGLAMPSPEVMDRLMRYQTTLQRQLSSAMGELLALVDRAKRN